MAHERIASVDIAKGIAIVAIVVGHVGVFYNGTELLEPWLYQFHVPVFFVIAGYFLSDRLPLGAFVVQKAKRLLVPYAITAAAVVVGVCFLQLVEGGATWPSSFAGPVEALLAALYGSGSWFVAMPPGVRPIGAIWFLPALFTALVIGRVSLQWKHGWAITVALAVVALATARMLWLPLSIQPGCVGSLFVSFGRLLRSRGFLSRDLDWLVMFACAALFVVAGVYNLKISLASLLSAGYMSVSLVVAASASVLCLSAARLIDDHRGKGTGKLADVLEFYGKDSLVVLCVHLFAIDLGLNTLVGTDFAFGTPAYSAILVAVHLALAAACIAIKRSDISRGISRGQAP